MPDLQDDDLLTGFGLDTAEEALRQIMATREAPPVEQTIIPMHEFPYGRSHRLAGTVRYPCVLGCGWAHDEDAYDVGEPCVFPLDAQGALDEQALNERLTARGEARRKRIEQAIRDHFAADHPDREIPLR